VKFVMEIKANSRQIPKDKEICSSKKYYDILYAYLQCISEKNGDNGNRTFAKKEINFSRLSTVFNLSR